MVRFEMIFVMFGGYEFLPLGASNFYVWGLIILTFGG